VDQTGLQASSLGTLYQPLHKSCLKCSCLHTSLELVSCLPGGPLHTGIPCMSWLTPSVIKPNHREYAKDYSINRLNAQIASWPDVQLHKLLIFVSAFDCACHLLSSCIPCCCRLALPAAVCLRDMLLYAGNATCVS